MIGYLLIRSRTFEEDQIIAAFLKKPTALKAVDDLVSPLDTDVWYSVREIEINEKDLE